MRKLESIRGLRPAARTKFFEKWDMNKVNNLNEQELRALVQRGAQILNPRIERLEKREASGEIAKDALEYIRESGGRFSVISDDSDKIYKTINSLRKEFKREKEFSQMETSTIKGAQKARKEREDVLRKNYTDKDLEGLSQDEINDILDIEWEKFRKFNEEHGVLYKQGKVKDLYQMYMSDDEVRRQKEIELDASNRQKKILEDVNKSTGYQPKIKPI